MNNNLQISKVRKHLRKKNNISNNNNNNNDNAFYENIYRRYKNNTILEIGCYNSPLASMKFKKYIGIDRNLPEEYNPNFLQGKFEDLNINETFDICICKDTSRYFSSPHDAIELMLLYSNQVILTSVEPYYDVNLLNKFKTKYKKIVYGIGDWDIDYQNNYSLLDIAVYFSNIYTVRNFYDGYRRTIHIRT